MSLNNGDYVLMAALEYEIVRLRIIDHEQKLGLVIQYMEDRIREIKEQAKD